MPGKISGRGEKYDVGHNVTLQYYRNETGDVAVGIEKHLGTETQETCTAVLEFDPPGPVDEGATAYTLSTLDPPTIDEQIECPQCAHAGHITGGEFFPA